MVKRLDPQIYLQGIERIYEEVTTGVPGFLDCWFGNGSDIGCCGNYSGCCWYAHTLCFYHDLECLECDHWHCLPGCEVGI